MFIQLPIVAAVQFEPRLLDTEANLQTAQQLAFEASAKGAKVVVLPELCISGQVLRNVREAADCAQHMDGYQTQALAPIARRFNNYIVFGYVEVREGLFYNSAAVIGPNGLMANTRKHNLYGSDNLWAQPGEDLAPTVVTEVGRLGVLICRDIANRYRESYAFKRDGSRFYTKGSVDVIAVPTNWGGTDYAFPDSGWVDLVEETRANVIIANRVGAERDIVFKGGSCVIDRDRRIWTNGSSFFEPAVVGGMIVP
jgi:predicted amidohydrolase